MITFLSRFKIKPEKEDEFVQLTRDLSAAVHANEPGCLAYQFYKLRDDDHAYAVFESFKDADAEDAHMNAPHFSRFGTPMIDCLDGPYIREYLDPVD